MKHKIFKENNNTNEIEYIGDFEGLYNECIDPWDKSAPEESKYSGYYKISRKRLVEILKPLNGQDLKLLEIGCGLGYVLESISAECPELSLSGVDISNTAVIRAKEKFPNYNFYCSDITKLEQQFINKFDVVVVSQMLWYILGDLLQVFEIIHAYTRRGGHLILTQAFFKNEQKFGREVIDGYEGLINFIRSNLNNDFEIVFENLFCDTRVMHDDGLIKLKRKA